MVGFNPIVAEESVKELKVEEETNNEEEHVEASSEEEENA